MNNILIKLYMILIRSFKSIYPN